MTDYMSLAVPIIAAIIIIVGVLMLWDIVKKRRSVLPVADERTRRAGEHAAYYALLIGQYFTLGLLWVLFLGPKFLGLPEIEAIPALIASLLVSSILFLALRWFFSRKENV
jgi:uncharacterized membrane protein